MVEKHVGFVCVCILICLAIFPATVKAQDVDRAAAQETITQAENVIQEMLSLGFGVTYANDTLREAVVLFEQGHYLAAETLARKVFEIKEKAVAVDKLMDEAEAKIYELEAKGYSTTDLHSLFTSALEEFKKDNYIDAENMFKEIINLAEERESEKLLESVREGEDIVVLLLDNLWLVILIAFVCLISGFKIKHHLIVKRAKKKFEGLKKEREGIEKRMKTTQREYFEKGGMSTFEYEVLFKKYAKRLGSIKKEMEMLKGVIK